MFNRLRLKNFLSFGPEAPDVELGRLNVLVGPNGSGKSNLVEAISLLCSCTERRGLFGALRRGGTPGEWGWRGQTGTFTIGVAVRIGPEARPLLVHFFSIEEWGGALDLTEEELSQIFADPTLNDENSLLMRVDRPAAQVRTGKHASRRLLDRSQGFDFSDSALAQLRDPVNYPELTQLAKFYERVRIYRDWPFGRQAPTRKPSGADLPDDWLLPDSSNLAMVLNSFKRTPAVVRRLDSYLSRLSDGFTGYDTVVQGGTIQLFLKEGDMLIPATRLSDGTLRYLALLATLLHPKPPPCIIIEEPELGLHPDLMPTLAELLLDASTRTQVIATTHSDVLVDALTEHPEALMVCDKDENGTRIRRLSAEELAPWLKQYSLGRLWRMGEIGGNRW